MNSPYDDMIDDLILEAEGLCFEDEDEDDAISVLSNGESDECLETTDELDDDDDDDELFDD